MLSVAATILWTTLGVETSFTPSVIDVGGGSADSGIGRAGTRDVLAGGFKGAGTRVGTGVLLGILVLGLGWTGIGSWVMLSWLVG